MVLSFHGDNELQQYPSNFKYWYLKFKIHETDIL